MVGLTNSGNETNSSSSDHTSNYHDGKRCRCSLKNTTDAEDYAATDDSPPTANTISNISSDDGTKECSAREDTGKQRLLPSLMMIDALELLLWDGNGSWTLFYV